MLKDSASSGMNSNTEHHYWWIAPVCGMVLIIASTFTFYSKMNRKKVICWTHAVIRIYSRAPFLLSSVFFFQVAPSELNNKNAHRLIGGESYKQDSETK